MHRTILSGGFLFVVLTASVTVSQEVGIKSDPADSGFTANYPTDRPGVLIQDPSFQDSSWSEVANQMPAKMKSVHGIAASLSYGAVPEKLVLQYAGDHAPTQVNSSQPIICICQIMGLPGEPVLVALHSKKGWRELDGGRMYVLPVVGGTKMADANKSDLIPADQAHPGTHVWLIRPHAPLAAGEYALMLGTQNTNIYPFTVTAPPPQPVAGK